MTDTPDTQADPNEVEAPDEEQLGKFLEGVAEDEGLAREEDDD